MQTQTIHNLMLSKLEATRRDLLDLGLRNALLNFRLTSARCIEVVDELPQQVFRTLVREKKAMSFLGDPALDKAKNKTDQTLWLLPETAPENFANQDKSAKRYTDSKLQTRLSTLNLHARLQKIAYDARASIEEQGVNVLYLALGMLEWYESENSEQIRYAPLLLIPVQLTRSDIRERFQLRYTEDELDHNLSLEAKLQADFGINLPHLPEDVEEPDLDIETYFEQIKGAVLRVQPRWKVNIRSIALGFFTFSKFLIYKDLDAAWAAGNSLLEHPILRGLLLGNLKEPQSSVKDSEKLDKHPVSASLPFVLDADSSQMLAMVDVYQGRNLIIHGPPGTGKSQTITNIIAQALKDDKKVLFVAEKMAALEVVKHRLDEVGLGNACLELHSHKTNKKSLLTGLRETLKLAEPGNIQFDDKIELLTEQRERLNAYSEAVNTPIGQSGFTPYQIFGELTQIKRQPKVFSLPGIEIHGQVDFSRSHYTKLAALVAELANVFKIVGKPSSHPFRGTRLREGLGLKAQEGLASNIAAAIAAVKNLRECSTKVAQPVGIPILDKPCNFPFVSFVLSVPNFYGLNLEAKEWLTLESLIAQLIATGSELNALYQRFEAVLTPTAWQQDVTELKKIIEEADKQWWRKVTPGFTRARKTLAGMCRGSIPEETAPQIELLDAIQKAKELGVFWNHYSGWGKFLFGLHWQDLGSNWQVLTNLAQWVQKLQQAIAVGDCPPSLPAFLAGQPNINQYKLELEKFKKAVGEHISTVSAVISQLDIDESLYTTNPGEIFLAQSYDSQIRILHEWQANLDKLPAIITFNHFSQRCREAGLAAYVKAGDKWPEASEFLPQAFHKSWLENLLEIAYRERPALNLFNRASHEHLIKQFRQLDRQILKYNCTSLAHSHWCTIADLEETAVLTGRRDQLSTELRLVIREGEKKKRHLPIRKLLKMAGRAIQTVKPVFMMSPLSVATYLAPGALEFDLVIFDEASQVRPAEALGAIVRGKQVVVAGDDKQLPPTSFFERLGQSDQDEVDEEAEYIEEGNELLVTNDSSDFESILTLFKTVSQARMLRWHYRSRHESLIAVSNSEFYENKLVIFPSPDKERRDGGLIYQHLPDAIYDRSKSRTNLEEARAVAKAIMEHARTSPALTLGVATFSLSQREAINMQLELLRRQDSSCESFFTAHENEPFFIKNLENVQGDERDVILISVGYGRDRDGKITMNFGPVTRAGGERRLNVLISRARRRCEVFTNLLPKDIDFNRTSSVGVRALRVFLEYARSGKLASLAEPTNREPDSPFEVAVKQALEERGYQIVCQIGQAGYFIDLAVVDSTQPGRYLLGIECDGATYHSAQSARDRDRLRQEMLEGLGWRIHRIWSTDWFHNPEKETERTIEIIRGIQHPISKPTFSG